MGNWAGRALRDWRVWALTFTIQGPGVRAIARYAPWPALLLPLVFVAAAAIYGACLHGPLVPWVRRFGTHLGLVAVALCVMAILNATAYPRVDALKLQGRGSDEDNALIDIAERLASGQRPIYVATYLGNAPSAGLGWAVLVAPLAITGTYALLTPFALGVLVWIVRRAGGGGAATGLALLLPLTSPGFWELSVTGSDLFAVGVLFVALTAYARVSRRRSLGASLVLVGLVVSAATTRAAFAAVTACVSLFMWRLKRSGAMLVGAATALIVASEVWLWWPDRAGATPLYLVSKLVGLLGAAGAGAAIVAAVSSAAWALAQLDQQVDTWWRGMWCFLAAPLAVVSIGALAALGWAVAEWQAAGYVEVAVPSLVAYVAISAGPWADAAPIASGGPSRTS